MFRKGWLLILLAVVLHICLDRVVDRAPLIKRAVINSSKLAMKAKIAAVSNPGRISGRTIGMKGSCLFAFASRNILYLFCS
ncbi:hypothetical protein [Desulfosarcina ovata]|uniref:hypothetical protein n=1 Tax=Desulfosarcina ovata TaxID=83564 RepID=UPI0012D2FDF0|nr:hypothetical protein [Desulfosarcina ovata]